ncbi:MAG: penicillin acylase family protein [Magnetospirillum sp.]|nr:penicillin acylase family protein [Magnetospirillum sp.]
MQDPLPPPRDTHGLRLDGEMIGVDMSLTGKVVNSVMLALVIAASVLFLWLMSSLPRIEGRVPIHGLELPASVARDALGVPHITARSQRDAYFVLGWTHAQDRLWQMEMQRRIGAGRLAEVVGEKALGSDRFMRTLGLYHLAEGSVDKLDKPARDALSAYAEGVNAWVDRNWYRLPLEFLVLGVRPEPWKPADSLVWARLMALQLTGNWRDEVLKAKLANRFDAGRLAELWPGYPANAPVTLSARIADAVLAAVPAVAEPRLASNEWAVAGGFTASGKPLLANDPHLGFQAPVLWYLAAIDAPGLTVAGATVPGVPFHLIGHNRRIAWGMTTTHADTVDLVVETLADDDSVLTAKGAQPFTHRRETIRVKDKADEVLDVRATAHGPVISDLTAKSLAGENQVVTMRATALEPDDLTAQAMLRLNRAVDWRGVTTALKDFHSPVQNFAYADTLGHIGFITAGRVPIRKGGDGSLPARGWTGDQEWTGWVPPAKLPQALDPPSGVVINANNKVTPPGYPYRISTEWPEPYRARRIGDLLAGKERLTVADMAAFQLDTLSLAALDLKRLLAAAAPTGTDAVEAARLIAAWDGHADRDGPEPLIYAAWVDRLWHAVFDDELGDDMAAFASVRPLVLAGVLTTHRRWCDDTATAVIEPCGDLITASLEQAVVDLTARFGPHPASWSWGEAHQARFDAPVLGKIPLLGHLATLSVATGGDDFTVNRGTTPPASFTHVHGAGLRAVYDLSDLDNSRFILATGQSGNALSRHYRDMMERWRDNRGITLGKPAEDRAAVLVLEPSY